MNHNKEFPPDKNTFTAYCFADGIPKAPHWQQMLGVGKTRLVGFHRPRGQRDQLLVDWGNKRGEKARTLQRQTGLPLIRLEDGFIRSVGLGVRGAKSCSLVVDEYGIYYDASRESRLERLLNGEPRPESPFAALNRNSLQLDDNAVLARARHCMDIIRAHGISKYNNLPELQEAGVNLGSKQNKRLLLVDQTLGDLSVAGGLASEDSFRRMLDDAINETANKAGETEIIIKTHPDVAAGKKRGYLDQGKLAEALSSPRVTLVAQAVNPYSLLAEVDEVWVVSSQLGFEALIAGKPVRCYGAPFYAGWGLTEDKVAIPRRKPRRNLEQVFAAAYFDYCWFFDPDTGEHCELETVLDYMALQRRMFKENAGQLICCGFPPWRRSYLRGYLQSPWNAVVFENDIDAVLAEAKPGQKVLFWGNTATGEQRQQLIGKGVTVWRVEDAFIRSVGLGKYYVPPVSLVIDKSGIYYDPRQSSDLEILLNTAEFSSRELDRSSALITELVTQKLSKYNVGAAALPPLKTRPGQVIILVPGQVESDASIAAGCPDIRTDRELLEAVRAAQPSVFILYKPHPDVVSGNEQGDYRRNAALADLTVTEVGIDDCIAVADEVHTLTSLAGFEALLRGKRVVTYGLPFYAGWGLTKDRHQIERRRRRLTLEQLVAGVLIRYPRYINLDKKHFTSPEYAVRTLVGQRDKQQAQKISAGRWQRLARKILNLGRSIYYGWRSSF